MQGQVEDLQNKKREVSTNQLPSSGWHTSRVANNPCRQNIRPHKAFKIHELNNIFRVAKKESLQMHALVRLLYDGALRIQDAVGLTFGDITLVQPD